MPFGSLFESRSETSNPVTTLAPQSGSSVENNPGGLVLNLSDSGSMSFGAKSGANTIREGDRIFNVTSLATDYGAVAAGIAASESGADVARASIGAVERSSEAFLGALSDGFRDYSADTRRVAEYAINQTTNATRTAGQSVENIARGALDSNARTVGDSLSLVRSSVDSSARTTADALALTGRSNADALSLVRDAVRTVGDSVGDALGVLRSSTAESLSQVAGVAARTGQATQGELSDTIKALAWPVGLAAAGFVLVRVLK